MERLQIHEILDIVREIAVSSTSIIDDEAPILPKEPKPLPEWSKTLPEGPLPLERCLDRLRTDVLPYLSRSSLSKRYYGFVTGGVTPAAHIGDMLASIFDQSLALHSPSDSIAVEVEVAALNMLVDLFNLPKDEWAVGTKGNGGGLITTGATGSNIVGLAMGREYVLSEAARRMTGKSMSVGELGILAVAQAAQVDQVKILSTLPHSSIAKAASVVGFGRSSVESIIQEGTMMTIDLKKLQDLAEDAEAQRTAYILAVSCAEVNSGRFATDSVEMMQQAREICDKYGIWIHVDAAMGMFARMLLDHPSASEYKEIVNGARGIEYADSITSDGHKLLNVPYDCGFFFTRHKLLSHSVFNNGTAAYLTAGPSDIQSPLNIGIENSRRFRALPVYSTLSAYGREGHCDMLIRQITLARQVSGWLWDHSEFELLPISQSKQAAVDNTFMIVMFRAKNREINKELVHKINATGKIYTSGTSWEGMPATRIAVSNWRADPTQDISVIQEVLDQVLKD